MQTQEKWGVFIAMALDDLDRLATEQVGQVARLDDLLFIVPQIALSHEAMAEIIDPTATKSPKMVIAAQFRTKFGQRSEEHTSELQSLMRISYAVFCLKKKKQIKTTNT